MYGKELILDIWDCSKSKFNRKDLSKFFEELCDLIDMIREDLHFWDYEDYPWLKKDAPPHLKGTSAIQFIKTSNITIHTLDDLKRVYLNIFSCKDFDNNAASKFCKEYFKGRIVSDTLIERM